MRNFLQNLKSIIRNSFIFRSWTENGPKLDRDWSEIGLMRSRFALVSLILLTMGVSNVWADCNYTFNDGATYTFYGEHYKSTGLFNSTKHYKVGKDGYVTIGSIDNTYGISHVQATGQFPDLWTSVTQNFTLQYKVDNGDWVTLGSAATIGKKSGSIYNQDVEISGGANQKVYFRLLCADPNSRFSDSQRFTISITVRKATTASMPSTLSVGSVEVDATSNNTKSFNFKHSNRNGQTITFSSDQSAFTVSPSSVTLACSGTETITVTYNPTCTNKPTSATITAKYGNNTLATMTASATPTLKDQTVNWNTTGKATSLVAGDTLIIGGYAASTSTVGDKSAIRYTSSNIGVIRVSGDTLFAVNGMANHSAIITAHQDPDCKFAYAYATQTFQVTDKAVPTFTLYINNVAQATKTANLKVGDVVEIHCTNAPHLQLGGEDNSIFTYSVNNDKSVVTVTANGERANAKLTVKETGNTRIAELEEVFTFNISKNETSLSSLLDVNNFYVGNSAYAATAYDFANGTAYNTNNTEVDVQFYTSNANVIDLVDGKIKAKAAGDATIKMWQAPNNKWTGDTVTHAITVNKHSATFTWNVAANYTWNQSISNPFTTNNNATEITCVSDNTNVAGYVDGKVVIYNVTGTAHFTLHQAGNDVWAEKSQQYTVNVTKANKHVPFALNQTLYNTLKDDNKSSGSYSWDGGIKIVNGGFEWDDKYGVIGPFEGVPYQLTCDYSCDGASTGRNWKIFESSDGSSWGSAILSESSAGTCTNKDLKPSTRYLKFVWSGNLTAHFNNISVTERREVKPHETADVDCGTANHGSDATEATAVLEWYNVKPLTCSITSAHPEAFELVTTSIDSKLDTYKKNQEIIVRGKHDVQAGTYTGTLHVTNGTESTTFNLTTTTTKQTPSIKWKNELSPMSVGDVVADAASAGSATVHYTVDGTYLTLNEQGAVVAENATDENGVDLIAYVEEDETWKAASETIKVVVTNLQKQTITWTDKLSFKFTGTKVIDLTATSSSGVEITYELSGTGNYATLDNANKKLTVTGIGSSLYLTAKTIDNAEYYPAARTKTINSRDPNASCASEKLYEEYAEQTLTTGVTSFLGEWVELDWSGEHPGAEPGVISFKIKRGTAAAGDMALDEWYDNEWHRVKTYENLSTSYAEKTETHSRKATKVRIGAPTGATLKHYVKDIVLYQAKYCELSKTALDFGTVTMGTAPEMSFTVHYSNLEKSLDIELENENTQFEVDKTYIGDDCGEHGTVTVTVTYNAANYVASESTNLIISNTEYNKKVSLTATVQKASQTITWDPILSLNTTDVVAFDAVTTDAAAATGIEVTYAVKGESDVATVTTDGHLNILKNGQVTIVASAEGNEQYADATPIEKTFTISKVTPTITQNPTINAITLPATLSDVTIATDATAKDDKNTAVTGSFAWQTGSTKVLSGANEYTIVFTPNQPTGKDWYNEVVYNISVTGNKDNQTIIWTRDDETTQPCSTPTTFDAYSNKGLPISYVSDDETVARVDKVGNEYHLVVLTGGTVHITAKQPGDGDYNAASDVTKTITLTREQPVIVIAPTADEIYTDNHLSDAGLSGGEGQVNGVHAEGIFAWKNGDIQPEFGTHTYAATFTPSPAAWYYPAECQVSVKVNKHPHSLAWDYAGGTIYVDKDDLYFSGATSSVELTNIYYTTSNAAVAEVDAEQGNKLIIHGKGTIEVIARSEGNTNYYAAEQRRTLKILPLTTTVIADPSAENITFGDALSESDLTGGTVKGSDDEVLQGTWSWNNGAEELNAGQGQVRGVTFTPNDSHWYATATSTATVNVNKANPTLSWTSAPTDLAYNATDAVYVATSASDGAIAYTIIEGGSYASINANGELSIIEPGHSITVQAAQAESANYNAPETITVEVIIAAEPVNEFTNATGNGKWDDPANWSIEIPQEAAPDVVVSGELVIDGEVTVGDLTIQPTGGVTIVDDGKLTVTGQSNAIPEYGDIHVMDDGELELGNTARLEVRHFTLDAKLGDNTEANPAASGQVDGTEKLNVNGDVYFQLSFDPRGAIDNGWYDFTVPFKVNINGGISRVNSGNDKVMVCGVDFLIQEADEVGRANGGKPWRNLRTGALQPGKLYSIGFDDEVYQNTFRFAWNGEGILSNGENYAAQCAPGSEESARGWNGIGNGMLRHGYLAEDYKVQAYDHVSNTYGLVQDDKTFAVGSAFFIQVPVAGNVDWTVAEATVDRPLLAPKRAAVEVEEFRLSLRNEDYVETDALFFSADEEATEAYVIGHDLLKMGTLTSAKKAQMWATKGGTKLCDVEAILINETAETPLSFFTPKAGEFTLKIETAPADAELYLTYNDNIIWNLTTSPYVFDLAKGTTNGYGLRMEARRGPQVTTGVDNADAAGQIMRKVVIDNAIYIVTPEGRMYDIVGKGVKY